jgi:hypothetical protein
VSETTTTTTTTTTMPAAPRTKSLIVAGAILVAVSVPAALLISNQRERRANLEVRKQSAFIMLDLTADMDKAAVAMHAFNADGGLDLSGLEDAAALERRIELAGRAQAASARVYELGESASQRLAEALPRQPPARVAAAQQDLPQRMNWAQGRHIFRTHADAYAAAKAHLEFLKTHRGHWRVDNVGLRVNWDSQQLQAEAEALQANVTAAAAEQGRLSISATTTTATTATTTSRPSNAQQ